MTKTPTARLRGWRAAASSILRRAETLKSKSDEELRNEAKELQWQARTGRPLSRMIRDTFALVCEASRRTTKMTPYLVQIMGGLAISEGHIAEMQTGEGKTLTATLPTTLYALPGKGAHVLTVNDYLAQRDAELMGPIYEMLGLTVGCVVPDMEPDERQAAYRADITYGTASEMGFDFLRDRLQTGVSGSLDDLPRYYHNSAGGSGTVQRGHFFALLDEADSILIDEAITPLIIGLPEPTTISQMSLLCWAQSTALRLEEEEDYVTHPERRSVTLTEAGARRVMLMGKPRWLDSFSNEKVLSHIETTLAANLYYQLDREYVVHNGAITIVDEGTGRMMEGRKWQRGLHQAMEVKEGVVVTEPTHHAAQITIQSFFRRYRHLAGMTGTAVQARRELKRVYRVKVTPIPTHKPCLREEFPCRIFGSRQSRDRALVADVVELVEQDRAVLIGTSSVVTSEELGGMLREAQVSHRILNARYLEQEAEIIADAGQPGRVTIATNMAGRGTDIIPHKLVKEQGGLHIIATTVHSSARIDRQLVGRTARQGDPGSFQFLLTLQDELLKLLPQRHQDQLQRLATHQPDGEWGPEMRHYFRKAQRILEKQQLKQRKQMLKHEEQKQEAFRRMGLDPFLECAEE